MSLGGGLYGVLGGGVIKPKVVAAGGAASITQTDTAIDTTDATTYTFSARSFGAEDADRVIAVTIHAEGANALPTLTSVSIGGQVASFIEGYGSSGNARVNSAIAYVALPTGTTGDIVVTWQQGKTRTAITVNRVIAPTSATPHDTTLVNEDTGLQTLDLSLDIPNNGCALAAASSEASTTATWTGLTETYDVNPDPNMRATAAIGDFTTGGTPVTVTVQWSSAPGYSGGCSASWS